MAMLLKMLRHHGGFPMILDTDIHNFYEHLVLKEIEKGSSRLSGEGRLDFQKKVF